MNQNSSDFLPVAPSTPEEEISLRDLLQKAKEYIAELRRNWWLIGLISLPFLVWQGYLAYTTPVMYDSRLTFMVDDEIGGSANMINSLLGDFGLGGSENNYDKILELAKSQRIMQQVLLEKVSIGDQKDFLANHFIRIQKIHEEEWYRKPKNPAAPTLNGFFFTRDSFERFNRLEYAAFKSLYGMLLGSEDHKPIFSSRYNDDSGIMSLSISTRSEALSIAMLNTIFEKLSYFYVSSSTQKELATFEIIKDKTDSLQRLLSGTEYRSAQFQERNNDLFRATDQLPQERFARNKAMYSLMYAEALKNLELADYALKDRLPYVQVIDAPIPPIVGYGYGKKKAVLLGLLLGLLVGSLFVIGRKFLSEQFKQ